MALSIVPAVSGSQRRWMRDVGLFWSGTVLGGLAAIAVASGVVALVRTAFDTRTALVGACALAGLGLLREVGLRVPLPYRRRQVPAIWRARFRSGQMSFLYGLTLGAGFLTLFTSSTHLTFVVLAPFAPWRLTVVSVLVYGVGKTAVVLVAAGTRTHADALERVVGSVRGRSGAMSRRLLGATCTALMVGSTLLSMKGLR